MTDPRAHNGVTLTRLQDPAGMVKGHPSRWGIAPAADIVNGSLSTQFRQPDAIYTTPADSAFGGATPSSETAPVSTGYLSGLICRYGIPRALPCLAYDDAGVAFPAGYVRAVCGSGARSTYGLAIIYTSRHWVDLRYHISGLPAATTGVVTFMRRTNWDSGPYTTTVFTVNVDGALGASQDILVTDLFSVPDTVIRQPGSAQFSLQGSVVWTGTAPTWTVVSCNPQHVTEAPVVPVSLPSGYTARAETDATQSPRRVNITDSMLSLRCPDQEAFTASRGTINGFSGWTSEMALGAPGFVNIGTTLAARLGANPRIFIGNELQQLDWYPASAGTRCFPSLDWPVNVADPTPYDSGWLDFTTLGGTINTVGQGYRNARIGGFFTVPGADIAMARMSIRIGGATVYGPVSIATLLTKTDYVDIANVFPATNDQQATVELRLEVTAATGKTVFGTLGVQLSPRIDVPMPSSIAGINDLYAQGGYDAAKISIPTPTYAIVNLGAGATSDPGAAAAHRWVTYLPPTKGLWRIHQTGFPTSSLTQGMFPVGGKTATAVQAGALCFAGARLWSTSTPLATTLLSVARTGIAMAAAGTTMSGANLSPATNGFFFGEITCPAAGAYRVWLECAAGRPNAELWVSLTDQWCMEAIAGSWRGGEISHRKLLPTLTTATAPPGAPANGAGYLIGMGATGIWSGHVGMVAIYASLLGSWRYLDPARGDVLDASLDGVVSVYSAGAWVAGSGSRMASVSFSVDAAQVVYVRCCTPEKIGFTPDGTPPAIAIRWEAL